ncbi:MAG TPA: GNAT family N-acetyltransferase [Streptosporangiaceae bacterium]|nr:GNAT family N-acetyltransferase [Streptosporangiaceae bacterium]
MGAAESQSFVRKGRVADAGDLARIQVARWREDYAGLVPADVLGELTSGEAEARWREHWAQSLKQPPTSRHRVLVAGARRTGTGRVVAGFAAFGPATDADRWPATDAELYELCVEPRQRKHGHGSRLLNAAAETLAEDGFGTVSAWVLEGDSGAQEFLRSAGWATDGARGELDMGTAVPLIRMHVRVEAAE